MNTRVVTLFFTLSFWSSGVALIRVLSAYQAWQSSGWLTILFLATVPLVWMSVVGMRRVYLRWYTDTTPPLSLLVALVLLCHGLALSVYPALYGAGSDVALASAWLLWFGGVALVIIGFTERRSR